LGGMDEPIGDVNVARQQQEEVAEGGLSKHWSRNTCSQPGPRQEESEVRYLTFSKCNPLHINAVMFKTIL
jgi:hypothetical protein